MATLTEAELLNLIDANIYANAPNQEITADVLNPLLKKIVQSMRNKSKPPFDLKKFTVNNSDLDGSNSYVLEHYLKCSEPEIVVYSASLGKIDRDYFDIIPIDEDSTRITYNEAISAHDPHNIYVIKLTDAGSTWGTNVVRNPTLGTGDGYLAVWTLSQYYDGGFPVSTADATVLFEFEGTWVEGSGSGILQDMNIILSAGDKVKINIDIIRAKTDGTTKITIGNDGIDISDLVNTPGTKTIYHTLQNDPAGNESRFKFKTVDGADDLEIDNVYLYPEA
jgi:hypothetical protein